MGSLYQFCCQDCGYQVQISGGKDIGMGCATNTIVCNDCRELYDVLTSDEPWLAIKADWQPKNYTCPKTKKHRAELWEHPGACPKCGCRMTRGQLTINWD